MSRWSPRSSIALGLTVVLASCGLLTAPRPAETAARVRVRKNAKHLSAAEKRRFVNAVLKLKRLRRPSWSRLTVYDQLVQWHLDAGTPGIDAAHMGPAFLPWHRAFLHYFETRLREVDSRVTLPYWDWTDPESTRAVFSPDLMGGNGDPRRFHAVVDGPFRIGRWRLNVVDPVENDAYQLRYIARAFGTDPSVPELPTSAEVEAALAVPRYDVPPYNMGSNYRESFRNFLEGWINFPDPDLEEQHAAQDGNHGGNGGHNGNDGSDPDDPFHDPDSDPQTRTALHNQVHVWVAGLFGPEELPGSGAMGQMSSPNDPVFFLHHCNVDRIWAEWERRHGMLYEPEGGARYGHNLNDAMWPFITIGQNITPADVLDHRQLGYTYDSERTRRR